jgi:hypothetical protein
MALTQFTAELDFRATTSDSSDAGADADEVALIGEVDFTPQFASDSPILAREYSPRATAFRILTVTGYVDTDGRLKNTRAGTIGVRLISNDPVLELPDPLVYRVDFRLTTPLGQPVRVAAAYFEAPDSDVTVQLAEVFESALSAAAKAPRISGGYFDGDGDVVFENEDGSALPAIEIPEGYLVFVDNGDSTWSVGG